MKKIMKAALLAMVLCLVLSAVTGCQYLEQLQSLINPTEPTEHVHILTKQTGYPATCVNNGIIDNWSCLACGKRFADAEATQEVTFADMEIVHDGKSGHGALDHEGKCELCHKYAAPAVGTAFQLKTYQAKIDKTLYFSGAVSGNFLATGDINAAVDVFLEETTGGYFIYFMNGDTKNYVDVYEYQEGKIGITVSTEAHGVWVWDDTLGTFTVSMCDRVVYMGTYNTYDTISISNTSYISDDNAANVGVSQFVIRAVVIPEHECSYSAATCTKLSACTICGLTTGELAEHKYDNGVVTDPTCTAAGYTTYTCSVCKGTKKETGAAATGHTTNNGVCDSCGNTITSEVTSYVFMATTADGTALYWDGTANSGKGKITTDASAAAKFVVEKVEGGYYIYTVVDGVNKYIKIGTSNTSLSLVNDATVVSYDATTGYVYANERYIATYGTQDIRTYKASNIPGQAGENYYFVLTAA